MSYMNKISKIAIAVAIIIILLAIFIVHAKGAVTSLLWSFPSDVTPTQIQGTVYKYIDNDPLNDKTSNPVVCYVAYSPAATRSTSGAVSISCIR